VPKAEAMAVQVGVRPYYLVDDMSEGALKSKLKSCANGPFKRTDFAISHRGAPLEFPEHTKEGYLAAIRMGAGILECDVTLTKDRELVCRHNQCDLAKTTDVLIRPELAAKCSKRFVKKSESRNASATCCTSDFTLAEFKSLKGKMDGSNPDATKVEEFLSGMTDGRTELYARKGTLMSHAETIALFDEAGIKMTPELKPISLPAGYTRDNFRQQIVNEYKVAKIDASRVNIQSNDVDDVLYWITHEPEFGKGASYLYKTSNPPSLTMPDLYNKGVRTLSMNVDDLVDDDETTGKRVPSATALEAKMAGFELVGWTLESGGRQDGSGDDIYGLMDVLAKDVGVKGVFSNWVGTTSYYANCMGLK
jgi:glycerophosphoryl diester phosphodiesterase